MSTIKSYRINGDPPPWSVIAVDKFVTGALGRAEDQGGALPECFRMSLCPWGERNALGGTPPAVTEITDPRLRLVHFTGCGRPYLVALFTGETAEARQATAMAHLPWSEHYAVTARDGTATLDFVDATEALDEDEEWDGQRTLRELVRLGELDRF